MEHNQIIQGMANNYPSEVTRLISTERVSKQFMNSSSSSNIDTVQTQILTSHSSNPRKFPKDEAIHCSCHVPDSNTRDFNYKVAQVKLGLAAGIALAFAIVEALGGYFSSSLAILADSAHMLSDFFGLFISLTSVWISKKPPTKKLTFGFHRAEIMGAISSVLIIWVVTGVLVYKAIGRFINPNYIIKADVMLITAAIGLYVNVFMALMLKVEVNPMEALQEEAKEDSEDIVKRDTPEPIFERSGCSYEVKKKLKWLRSKLPGGGSDKQGTKTGENINVRAAFIHVLGDIVQSVGIITASYIIRFYPNLKFFDPICTIIFALLVLTTTYNIMKDAVHVLMEGTPLSVNYTKVKKDLLSIDGVLSLHSIYIWSISSTKTALAAHIAIDSHFSSQAVLSNALEKINRKHKIDECTLQIELYNPVMRICNGCNKDDNKENSKGLCSCCYPNYK